MDWQAAGEGQDTQMEWEEAGAATCTTGGEAAGVFLVGRQQAGGGSQGVMTIAVQVIYTY